MSRDWDSHHGLRVDSDNSKQKTGEMFIPDDYNCQPTGVRNTSQARYLQRKSCQCLMSSSPTVKSVQRRIGRILENHGMLGLKFMDNLW